MTVQTFWLKGRTYEQLCSCRIAQQKIYIIMCTMLAGRGASHGLPIEVIGCTIGNTPTHTISAHHVCICDILCTNIYTHIRIYIQTCIYICAYIYICMYLLSNYIYSEHICDEYMFLLCQFCNYTVDHKSGPWAKMFGPSPSE